MSKVTGQNVPPSLIADYQALFDNRYGGDTGKKIVSINHAVREGWTETDTSPDAVAASAAASWLTERWQGSAATSIKRAFFAQRRAEIMAGSYPGTYWWTPSPVADKTEYCTPVQLEILTPENSSINPLYWDETRQPRHCVYENITRNYNTPSPPGTEQNPAPGWKGSVTNGIWQDLYHAQRRRDYNLPITLQQLTDRPVILDLNASTQIAATTRGHRNWFALCIVVYNRPPGTAEGATFLFKAQDRYPYALPAADPNGWSHTITRRIIRKASDYWDHSSYYSNKLSVRVATVPARGYYFSRNDLVTAYNQIALTVAVAKTP